MKFTNLLSNDTGENTKHFQLDACGFDTMPQLETSIRELRDYLKRMWSQAPAQAKAIAEATVSRSSEGAPKSSRAEPSVDLSVLGSRVRSLADMCKDNNTDLESACISVQRSGVGFVNPREFGKQPQKMQQMQPQDFPPQYPPPHHPQQQYQQQFAAPQTQFAPPPSQQQFHSDMSSTTQTVLQLANIKLMQKLVGAINRMVDSGSDRSYSSDADSVEELQPRALARPSSSSSQRPSSASVQRPVLASDFESSASRRPSSSSRSNAELAQHLQSGGRASPAPRSHSSQQQGPPPHTFCVPARFYIMRRLQVSSAAMKRAVAVLSTCNDHGLCITVVCSATHQTQDSYISSSRMIVYFKDVAQNKFSAIRERKKSHSSW